MKIMMKNRAGIILGAGSEIQSGKAFFTSAMLHCKNSFSCPAKGGCSPTHNHLSFPALSIGDPLFTGTAKIGQTGTKHQGYSKRAIFIFFSVEARP
jgi:hypothetical protein